MTNDEVHSQVVRLVREIAGVSVIKTHQSGSPPAEPYIAVNMTGVADVRRNPADFAYTASQSGGEEVIETAPIMQTEWRFSVHAYGEDPSTILRRIRSAAQVNQIADRLPRPLKLVSMSAIRNVPDWQNEAWQPRAQMDIIVHGQTRDGFVIDVIEEQTPAYTPI